MATLLSQHTQFNSLYVHVPAPTRPEFRLNASHFVILLTVMEPESKHSFINPDYTISFHTIEGKNGVAGLSHNDALCT